MKPINLLLCACLLTLALAGPALADAAPPLQPPGSNVAPEGVTQVQMVAETVVLEVLPPPQAGSVHVRADFTMRNLGEAEERMQARFPLEDPSGMGGQFPQAYGQPAGIQDIVVEVNGQRVPTHTIEEPAQWGEHQVPWAAFDVAFPVGQDVKIAVSYNTDLTGYRDPKAINYGWASAHYILETGAGWRGAIDSADIILRLPYETGPDNVFLKAFSTPGGQYAGQEVRWHWDNLEPAAQDNLVVHMVWPDGWQRILELQEKVAAEPDDIGAAIELAEAYRQTGSRKGFVENEHLAGLSQETVEQALERHPESAELHAELAAVLWWRYYLKSYPAEGDPAAPAAQAALQEIDTALRLDPKNKAAQDLLQWMSGTLGITPTPSPSPTRTALATASPSPTGTASATATPAPTLSAPTPPGDAPASALAAWPIALIVVAALGLAAFFLRPKG